MSIIFLLIMVSLCLAICFLFAFVWAVKSGQYEDDYSPSVRVLFEDQGLDASSGSPLENSHTQTPQQ